MSTRRAVEKVRWSRMMMPASRVICTIATGDDGTIARSSTDEAFTICVTRANRRRPKAHAQLSLVGLRSHDERLSGSSSMYIRTSSPAGQLLRPMLCTPTPYGSPLSGLAESAPWLDFFCTDDRTICRETASGAHELHGEVSTVAWDRRTGELRPFALRCNELVHGDKNTPCIGRLEHGCMRTVSRRLAL